MLTIALTDMLACSVDGAWAPLPHSQENSPSPSQSISRRSARCADSRASC